MIYYMTVRGERPSRFTETASASQKPYARISLSSGIVDVTIRAPRIQFSAIVKELSDIAAQLSEFPHIFPLSNSIKLILPEEDYIIVRGKWDHLREAATQANVSKLILNLSPRAE